MAYLSLVCMAVGLMQTLQSSEPLSLIGLHAGLEKLRTAIPTAGKKQGGETLSEQERKALENLIGYTKDYATNEGMRQALLNKIIENENLLDAGPEGFMEFWLQDAAAAMGPNYSIDPDLLDQESVRYKNLSSRKDIASRQDAAQLVSLASTIKLLLPKALELYVQRQKILEMLSKMIQAFDAAMRQIDDKDRVSDLQTERDLYSLKTSTALWVKNTGLPADVFETLDTFDRETRELLEKFQNLVEEAWTLYLRTYQNPKYTQNIMDARNKNGFPPIQTPGVATPPPPSAQGSAALLSKPEKDALKNNIIPYTEEYAVREQFTNPDKSFAQEVHNILTHEHLVHLDNNEEFMENWISFLAERGPLWKVNPQLLIAKFSGEDKELVDSLRTLLGTLRPLLWDFYRDHKAEIEKARAAKGYEAIIPPPPPPKRGS